MPRFILNWGSGNQSFFRLRILAENVILVQDGREDGNGIVRPIFRWAGGKQRLIDRLLALCPPKQCFRRYHEPFLGAASLFFALEPGHAHLADANPHLINTYKEIRNDPVNVASILARISQKDSSKFYYLVRAKYNRDAFSPLQAARFIYLNRTCFNGIFRVNKQGKFNVPYGYKNNPKFPSVNSLRKIAYALRTASLLNGDYKDVLKQASPGDFVYLDPPYPALNGTSNFAHYTTDRFDMEQQSSLAGVVKTLDTRGCLVMVSNADTKIIRELYDGFQLTTLKVTRHITCKSVKHKVHELVITNYPPKLRFSE